MALQAGGHDAPREPLPGRDALPERRRHDVDGGRDDHGTEGGERSDRAKRPPSLVGGAASRAGEPPADAGRADRGVPAGRPRQGLDRDQGRADGEGMSRLRRRRPYCTRNSVMYTSWTLPLLRTGFTRAISSRLSRSFPCVVISASEVRLDRSPRILSRTFGIAASSDWIASSAFLSPSASLKVHFTSRPPPESARFTTNGSRFRMAPASP